MMKNFIFKQ